MQINNCRGELRERRPTLDNILNQNIKPLSIHRQGKLEHRVTTCSVLDGEEKENIGRLTTKILPQHVEYATIRNNQQISIGKVYQLIGKEQTQVQSIIFDSRTAQFNNEKNYILDKESQLTTLQSNSYLDRFQIQTDKINSQIETSLSHIEETIRDLKHKKQLRLTNKKLEKTGLSNKLAKQSTARQQEQIASKQVTADSQIQIQGRMNKQIECFPQEYVSLISRLTRQIDRDIAFTSKVSYYTKSNLIAQIKAQCVKEINNLNLQQTQFDQSFLKIQPAEMDPLDQAKASTAQKSNTQQIKEHAVNLLKYYRDLQTHYYSKLHKQFQASTIQLLFKQLREFNFSTVSPDSIDSVTVGHLLSYINMRTNKSFRNRSFVKMLKRLNLKPNSPLNLQAFAHLIKS